MRQPRILVAGIGNIFLGDDGFGVEVIRRMAQCQLSEGVTWMDSGIRGLDLALALLDNYDLAILIDTLARGGLPGRLYLLEPDLDHLGKADIQTHNIDPIKVFQMVKAFGELPARCRFRIVGCEPHTFGPEGIGQMGLSDPVAEAVEPAVRMVQQLIHAFQDEYLLLQNQNQGLLKQQATLEGKRCTSEGSNARSQE
jgi:hydrogenase maturation protease